ncbi:MAG: phosphoribosylamine--glycine ligase [Limisphaerales bacterium]|jgi:phosphoribosylamine--glycine ligase
MRVLLLGSGGREHALAWKIKQSPKCESLWIAPGNPGTADCGTNVNLQVDDFEGIRRFCIEQKVEMLVVGPEVPLVKGIADFIEADPETSQIIVIGPNAEAAQLEGSKAYAKEFLFRHNIPTANYKEFKPNTIADGLAYLAVHPMPVVLKADGLAAGKGVIICQTSDEAKIELKAMLTDGKFGEAGASVVVEEFLDGIELSVFALSDGKDWVILPTSKDYKRIGEGDTGLNTGGMGAISPVPFADDEFMSKIDKEVISPSMLGLQKDGIKYKGFLYFGIIKVNGSPFVIEYNCRMGDPETQAVIPLIENDLLDLFSAVGKESLSSETVTIRKGIAATVILASGGYPGSYQKGLKIEGLESVKSESVLFHAGTSLDSSGQFHTNGGRVLALTTVAKSMEAALEATYKSIDKIEFEGAYYRRDIGFDLK